MGLMRSEVGTWIGVLALLLTGCVGSGAAPTPQPSSTSATSTTAPTATTTTTIPVTTTVTATTTTMALEPSCRPDPFPDEIADQLAAAYPGALLTAHVYDTRTGCSYELNPESRQRTASVFKVMVMAGTLLEAQEDGREVTEWEMAQMVPMITESTNPQVRGLWRSFGAGSWFTKQAEIFGLTETEVEGEDGVTPWGRTHTSALDQVNLLRQVLLGDWGPLDEESRAIALDLMTSVVPSQTWGVTAGVPDDWAVAQKNGFAGPIINSVGWVDPPGDSEGWVVAILTEGWSTHAAGIAAVERINELVVGAMLLPEVMPPDARIE